MTAANSHIFKFQLEQKNQNAVWTKQWRHTGVHLHPSGVTLIINAAIVIRKKKMAMEAISPSLSPFEGRFAAQRQTPNRIPEFGAHPHSEDWQRSRQESGWETQRLKERKRERERVLKADLTLGSVTTDQNPLKAIDHFHYSSHVPHLETVYQTQKSLCGQIHTPTHAHEARMPAHTHAQNNTAFPSQPAALKHLYRLGLSLQTNVYSKAALRPVQWDLLMPTLPTSESTAVTEKRLLLFPAELPVICCQPLTKRCARTVQAGGFQKKFP